MPSPGSARRQICFRNAALLQMFTVTPSRVKLFFKEKKYVMIGIKKPVFLC
jgi:hypothetical protein